MPARIGTGPPNARHRPPWPAQSATGEHFERVKSVVAEANEQNLDRLAAELGRSRLRDRFGAAGA